MKILSLLLFILMTQTPQAKADIAFPADFFFGVANAPSQVEDELIDTWVSWANKGKVVAYHNQTLPEERIRFWSEPEKELDLAASAGVKVFRLGVDWARLFPSENSTTPDPAAVARYREILKMIKDRKMKVMLTIFHHSEPEWTLAKGSWANPKMLDYFKIFSESVVNEFGDMVDYWITFNEANIYLLMTQVVNAWPNKDNKPNPLGLFNFPFIKGKYERSLERIGEAHRNLYHYIKKQNPNAHVGFAHNVADYTASGPLSVISAWISNHKFNDLFMKMTVGYSDFIGINFYGAEIIKGLRVTLSNRYEYSDSGRAVSPNSFYDVLKSFHRKYNIERKHRLKNDKRILPIIITENGVADAEDWMRPSFLIEHLHALHKAMSEGVLVSGYITWTLTDNFEWSDGYCPKFGLVAVDRDNNFERLPRESYYIFETIAKTHSISSIDRAKAWKRVLDKVGKPRAFCRSSDGITPLDTPRYIPVRSIDWRFH
jgi:beta-glucosidase/6-phospho-beta-glucosidase/beta-galactosidase